jgi:Cu/Ag efflux pump CusA
MTTAAMIAGMVPMALAFGEGGAQTAPLGRAVIGGLGASTLAVLLIVPLAFRGVLARTRVTEIGLYPLKADDRPHDLEAEGVQ